MKNIIKSNLDTERIYSCIISLGFFCSIAIDSETLHYREYSFPFDWFITDFENTVIKSIENNFHLFFNQEDFEKDYNSKNHFYNLRYDYWSFHDFKEDVPLLYQFQHVKKKIYRRIKRFNNYLKTKTCLFIRYCKDQEEISFIINNINYINTFFKKNNSNIIFICNDDLDAPDYFYKVKKDINDVVNRHPLTANKELGEYIDKYVCKVKTRKNRLFIIKEKIYKNYIRLLAYLFRTIRNNK